MIDQETRAVIALAMMVDRYLARGPDGQKDHSFENPGEFAMLTLSEYGLMDLEPRGGRFTEKGRALLATMLPIPRS
jgi:hypothetical protein